jgi:hypothetical protein
MAKWQKGQSGNAGGRPKEVGGVREMARERSENAILTLEAIMNDTTAPHASRLAAANSLLDRAHGKPTQIIETLPEEEKPADINQVARKLWFALECARRNGLVLDNEALDTPTPCGALPAS